MSATTQVMAHRGASKVERENTVEAFRRAAAMGAHAVELDVRRASDGALVVHHDPVVHLDGVAEPAAICDLRHADLPAHVPTLGAALDACAGMWVNVEIKNDPNEPDFDPTESIADATIAHLLAREDDRRWLISSFRMETVDRCRSLAPQIRTAWLCGEPPAGVGQLLMKKGHLALHPWFGVVTAELIAECHAAGVQVNTWTCDDPEWMQRLLSWGIDGICTNVPDVALDVIASQSH